MFGLVEFDDLHKQMIGFTSKIGWLKYLPFANSDMSLSLYHFQPHPEMTIKFSITVLMVHIIVLLMISMLVCNFKLKSLSHCKMDAA